jgi:glycosyltransferase A (GT-A) superfamily protein (DUF2064 family)
VVGQGTGSLDRRLTTTWRHAAGPALLIGMDTPQLSAGDLDAAMSSLASPGVDAVLGPATDGGWWTVGLRQRHPAAFLGVPASRSDTGARQALRLRGLGLAVHLLGGQTDVDTWADAVAVAAAAPATRFAAAVRAVAGRLVA